MMASTICKEEKRSRTASDKAKQKRINGHQNVCFTCRGSDDQLVKCSFCPCSYHMHCLPSDTVITKPRWGCPAHKCSVCFAKTSSSRGKIYRCIGCPRAFCFNHTPQGSTVLQSNPLEELYGYATGSFVFIVCSECQEKDTPLIASLKEDAERKVLVKSATNGKSEENSSSDDSPPLAVLPKQRKRSSESSEHEPIPKKLKTDSTPPRLTLSVNPHATRQAYSTLGSAPQYLYNTAAPTFDNRLWQEYSEADRQLNYYGTEQQIGAATPSFSYSNHITEVQPTIAPAGLSYFPHYETHSQSSSQQPQYHHHFAAQMQPQQQMGSASYSLHYSPALLPINVNPLNGVSHPLTNEHVTEYTTRLENFRATNS